MLFHILNISIGKLQDQCGQALLRNLLALAKTEADHNTSGTRRGGKNTFQIRISLATTGNLPVAASIHAVLK